MMRTLRLLIVAVGLGLSGVAAPQASIAAPSASLQSLHVFVSDLPPGFQRFATQHLAGNQLTPYFGRHYISSTQLLEYLWVQFKNERTPFHGLYEVDSWIERHATNGDALVAASTGGSAPAKGLNGYGAHKIKVPPQLGPVSGGEAFYTRVKGHTVTVAGLSWVDKQYASTLQIAAWNGASDYSYQIWLLQHLALLVDQRIQRYG